MSDEPKAPQPPEELWMLWDVQEGRWVEKDEGSDEPGGGYIACPDFTSAAYQAYHQARTFDVASAPVRVK